ncbi:dipeptide epimerase [Coprobacter tertius]|uniref:Dipeptide epimerase n=1 Tax=Coprobacter tertius TaxID=2944915 RepID=A0ABT1MF08_9BACT|nr:dipeptide epimerase [Coprobacter tertius]MCP9611217.1 dipeptide epimerase [Coprobacter tertius]
MKLSFEPYTLELRHVFTLSSSSRTTTPVVLVMIESEGYIGYGEASLPPYLKETQQSVTAFLSALNLNGFSLNHPLEDVLGYIENVAPENTAAKAAVDIALHDLYGKAREYAWWQYWGLDRFSVPDTSFTIGIDTEEGIRCKTLDAKDFNLLKVKLGRHTDKMIISAIRSVTDKPICVDVNQGWTDKYEALDMLHWCKEQGVIFAEQPMPKEYIDDMAWLTAHSPIPTIADESFQRISDLKKVKGVFSGINIKLMKCTGMNEAYKVIHEARDAGMKVMLGCMTETSCAISAAAQLSPWVDWADLDGNLLITNDCFYGATLQNGKIISTRMPGIGIKYK